MSFSNYYLPPDNKLWQGRPDLPNAMCFFQIIQLLNLQGQIPPIKQTQCFALIGFCCDEGIHRNYGRTGAIEGPFTIRETLARLTIQKHDIICYDAGDIICPDGELEKAQAALGTAVALLLDHHITPIVLGGGHELAWGHYQGIAKKYPQENLGIVNFDAHFDMRPLLENRRGNSGTSFLQIALDAEKTNRRFDYNCIGIQNTGNMSSLFETAKKFNTHFITADHIYLGEKFYLYNFIDRVIDQNKLIYVSICLDVFATAYAPGVSAPQVLGLTAWQVLPMIRQLAASKKVISYDIAELSPKYDIDSRTAKLAANIVAEIIQYHAS